MVNEKSCCNSAKNKTTDIVSYFLVNSAIWKKYRYKIMLPSLGNRFSVLYVVLNINMSPRKNHNSRRYVALLFIIDNDKKTRFSSDHLPNM